MVKQRKCESVLKCYLMITRKKYIMGSMNNGMSHLVCDLEELQVAEEQLNV